MPCLYENNKFRISFGKPFVEEWYEDKRFDCFVAPLASELLERLPFKITLGVMAGKTQTHYLYCMKTGSDYDVFYAMNNGQTRHTTEEDKTLCNALARLWLYLKKHSPLRKKEVSQWRR